MRSTTPFSLLTFTLLIVTTLLNTSEALGQAVRVQPQVPQVAPQTFNFPQPHPYPYSYPYSTYDLPQPTQPLLAPIQQTPMSAAPRAVQPAHAAFAIGTPSPDTTTAPLDVGAETPTPAPSPTATLPQTFRPTPSSNEADDTSTTYRTPSPDPTATPSPLPNYSTSTTGYGSWWLWLIGVVGVVWFIRASRRRSGRN